VFDVNQSDKATRRRRGKTDAIDAEAAARAVLAGRATATAKTGDGPVEMARMFKLAKDSAGKSRPQAINHLKAVLVVAAPALRESLSGLSSRVLIRRCAQLDTGVPTDATSAAAWTLRLLAHRIGCLTKEIDDLNASITAAVTAHTPQLLECNGVGPDPPATLLIPAGDNPQRLGSEAGFAALCGVSPVEASSARRNAAASTAAVTGRPTPRCIASRCPASPGIIAPATTSTDASPKVRHPAKRSAASSATSPASAISSSPSRSQPQSRTPQPLDIHRGISP